MPDPEWTDPDRYRARLDFLRENLDGLQTLHPTKVYPFEDVSETSEFRCLEKIRTESFVYAFILRDRDLEASRKVRTALKDFQKSGRTYTPKVNGTDSPYLYVGSSRTNIVSRLKQHCGSEPKTTYALKLAKWFSRKDLGSVDVEVAHYPGLNPVQLQMLEDAISLSTRPMFGKLGSNGK